MKHNIATQYRALTKIFGTSILWLLLAVVVVINLSPFMDSQNALMDFGSFYASGLKAQSGENPYDPNSVYIFEINFSRVEAGGKMMNLNPPISVLFFEFMSRFEPHRSLSVWQTASAILYIASVFFLASAYKQNSTPTRFVWAFTLAGFWHTIVLGQIYVVLLLFTVLGWIFLQKGKYVAAGIAIGLVLAIKPNFVVWSIFLLLGGYYAAALVSVIISLLIGFIPVLYYGADIYTQWLDASALRQETLRMPGNNSILGLTARFDSLLIGLAISVIVVLALLVLSKAKTSGSMKRPEFVSALGIIASLLASPISWTGYTILLLPIFFSLKKWTWPMILAAAILSVPFQIVLLFFQNSFVNFVLLGWLYGWGMLLLLAGIARNAMTVNNSSPVNEE